MSNGEKSLMIKLVNDTKDIEGDLVEVGVYQGGSAAYIHEAMNPDKTLYLCDAFEEGFVGAGEFDPPWIQALQGKGNLGSFSPQETSYDSIMEYFKGHNNVHVIKGSFPESVPTLFNDKKFSFINLDTDIYWPTLKALEMFYPRVPRGGVILTHDYIHANLQGVKKAYDEFFADKPEKIEISESQGYIIKL